ncbi:MAG: hypothetical protein ABIO40_01320 [Devosia sp.]
MTTFYRFVRAILAVAVLAFGAFTATAGTAETAFLAKYVGSWTGSGKMTGAETGPISCRLTFKQSGAKVNYAGRCNFKDMGAQSFTGTLSYNDAKARYESRANGKTVIGTRQGNALTFVSSIRTMEGSGTSAMTLGPNTLTIDTTIKSSKGETAKVKMTFKKN